MYQTFLITESFLIQWIHRMRILLLSPPAPQSSGRVGTPSRHRSSYILHFTSPSCLLSGPGWRCIGRRLRKTGGIV